MLLTGAPSASPAARTPTSCIDSAAPDALRLYLDARRREQWSVGLTSLWTERVLEAMAAQQALGRERVEAESFAGLRDEATLHAVCVSGEGVSAFAAAAQKLAAPRVRPVGQDDSIKRKKKKRHGYRQLGQETESPYEAIARGLRASGQWPALVTAGEA